MPPRDLDVNRPLRSLNFSHLIGSPLLACIDAQEKAAQCSREYIEEVGLETDDDGKKEAIMVSFSFIQDGQAVELTVPLLSIVPIPYFSIDLLEINFRANVKISDGEITASYAAGNDSKNVQSSLYNVESAVDIHVKASQDDMPAGLSKVLGVLGNSIRSYSDSVEIPADADDQLVRLLCDVTHTPAIFTRKEDGEEVVDKVLTRIAEVDAMQVRELYINYKDYPFRDLGALSILTHLTNLTLTYDSAKVQKLDFKAVPNLTRLKLTDLNEDPWGGVIFDFEPLTMLRILRLKKITNYSEHRLNLKKLPLLQRVNLTECQIKELDVSDNDYIEMVSLRKSQVEKLLVDPGFSEYYLYGDPVGEVVKNEETT